jgi:sodium/hydrogen antiporter
VEDEDGEVVKTYELPTQKTEGQEGSALLNSSLKYMGLGAFRNPEKAGESSAEKGEVPVTPGEVSKVTSRTGWPGFSVLAGAASGQAKKKTSETDGDDDDNKIRFTIGGAGARLTKEEFIKQMQNLDAGERKQIVNESDASDAIKTIANQDPPPRGRMRSIAIPKPNEDLSERMPSSSSAASGSTSDGRSPVARGKQPSDPALTETSVERKRRLAVLGAQEVEDDEADQEAEPVGETPAERRRRQAALGVAGTGDDSEDEGTERVPPARRGIRFAPEQQRVRR